jgi:hypothetical protein
MKQFGGGGDLYGPTWKRLLDGHDPYKVTQELSASNTFTTMLDHDGTVYEFRYKGEPFSPYSTLLVTSEDSVCREYKKGWELEVVSRAIEDVAQGWEKPTAYARGIYNGWNHD